MCFYFVSKQNKVTLFEKVNEYDQEIPGLEVIKFEYSLRLEIKRNDWLLADMCPQAASHCALF